MTAAAGRNTGLTGRRRRLEVPCTIDVEHSFDSLHAHVDLGERIEVRPGDSVTVHGEPIRVAYGERVRLERRATVVRAPWPERVWTRLAARFELMELLEVSFSTWRRL